MPWCWATGVDEPQREPAQLHRLLHRVPGGAGDVGDDGPVIPRKGVEEGGLACVGPPHQGAPDALVQPPPPLVGGQQPVQGPLLHGQVLVQLFLGKGVDVLIRIVQHP